MCAPLCCGWNSCSVVSNLFPPHSDHKPKCSLEQTFFLSYFKSQLNERYISFKGLVCCLRPDTTRLTIDKCNRCQLYIFTIPYFRKACVYPTFSFYKISNLRNINPESCCRLLLSTTNINAGNTIKVKMKMLNT